MIFESFKQDNGQLMILNAIPGICSNRFSKDQKFLLFIEIT